MADSPSNILSWSPANMITVSLMVGLTFFVVAAIAKVIKNRQAS